MNNELSTRNPMQCRACDNVRGNREHATVRGVFECSKCGALFGSCYLGDSFMLVRPFMASSEVAHEHMRYFDFSTLGSEGLGRRHGWFDVNTKLITQVG